MKSTKSNLQRVIEGVKTWNRDGWSLVGNKAMVKDRQYNTITILAKETIPTDLFKKYIESDGKYFSVSGEDIPSQWKYFDVPTKIQNKVKKYVGDTSMSYFTKDGLVGTNGHHLIFVGVGRQMYPTDIPIHPALLGLSQTFQMFVDDTTNRVWWTNGEFFVCVETSLRCPNVDEVNPAMKSGFYDNMTECIIPNAPTHKSEDETSLVELVRLEHKNGTVGFFDWAYMKAHAGSHALFTAAKTPLYIANGNHYILIMGMNIKESQVTKL